MGTTAHRTTGRASARQVPASRVRASRVRSGNAVAAIAAVAMVVGACGPRAQVEPHAGEAAEPDGGVQQADPGAPAAVEATGMPKQDATDVWDIVIAEVAAHDPANQGWVDVQICPGDDVCVDDADTGDTVVRIDGAMDLGLPEAEVPLLQRGRLLLQIEVMSTVAQREQRQREIALDLTTYEGATALTFDQPATGYRPGEVGAGTLTEPHLPPWEQQRLEREYSFLMEDSRSTPAVSSVQHVSGLCQAVVVAYVAGPQSQFAEIEQAGEAVWDPLLDRLAEQLTCD